MNKYFFCGLLSILISFNFAQKLQLTEAATEFRNNYNSSWISIPDSLLRSTQLAKNKPILLKTCFTTENCMFNYCTASDIQTMCVSNLVTKIKPLL